MVLRVWLDRMAERDVQDSVSLPCKEGSFAALSELTGLSPTTLHSITLHQYTQVVVSHVQPIESVLLNTEFFTLLPKKHYSHHFRSDRAAAWCLQCITEGRLHQLIWQSRFTMICLRHDCFLEDRCPACGCKIPIFDVCKGRCRSCGTHLLEHKPLSRQVDDLTRSAQVHFQSWMEPTMLRPGTDTVLPGCSPRDAYHILFVLFSCVYHASDRLSKHYSSSEMAGYRLSDNDREPEPSITEDYPRLIAVFRIMSDWPNFFLTFLDQTGVESIDVNTRLYALGST